MGNCTAYNGLSDAVKNKMNFRAEEIFDKFPLTSFKVSMKLELEVMDRRCNKTKGIVVLLRKILKAYPMLLPAEHSGYKRFIAELVLLLSLYSAIEVSYFSSEVNQIEQAQRHIIAAIEELFHVVDRIQQQLQMIDEELQKTDAKATFKEVEFQIQTAATIITVKSEVMID